MGSRTKFVLRASGEFAWSRCSRAGATCRSATLTDKTRMFESTLFSFSFLRKIYNDKTQHYAKKPESFLRRSGERYGSG